MSPVTPYRSQSLSALQSAKKISTCHLAFTQRKKGRVPGELGQVRAKKVLKRTFPRRTQSEKECQDGAKKTPTGKAKQTLEGTTIE